MMKSKETVRLRGADGGSSFLSWHQRPLFCKNNYNSGLAGAWLQHIFTCEANTVICVFTKGFKVDSLINNNI